MSPLSPDRIKDAIFSKKLDVKKFLFSPLEFQILLDDLYFDEGLNYFTISTSIRNLLEEYILVPENSKQKFKIAHPAFTNLEKDSQKLIKGVVKEIYKNDLEILRKAFIEKFEFYLRLINDSLQDANCEDKKLLGEIASIREQIANVVNESELSEDDLKWLKKIGFKTINIWEIGFKTGIEGVLKELRDNVDEYKLILGDLSIL